MSRNIYYEPPPAETPPELAAWLERQVLQIQDALETRLDVDTAIELDAKPQNGMFRYLESGPDGPGFYGYIAGTWSRFSAGAIRLLGIYDQVADDTGTGQLVCASDPSIQDGDSYIVDTVGVCSTLCPDIAGQTCGPGDQIIAVDGVWRLVPTSQSYLSSVVDDVAEGHITLIKTPSVAAHAAQKQQVDAVQTNLNTHAGHTASVDDVHGTKTYTDQQVDALGDAVLDNFVSTSYGGLILQTTVATPDIPAAAWATVPFDTGAVATPRDIIQDPTNDRVQIGEEGVYFTNITLAISHVEKQQGRTIYVRLYNETSGTSGNGVPIGIARNQPASTITLAMIYEASTDNVGDWLRVEVGNGDAVNVTEWSATSWTLFHISEYKGVLV